MWLLRAAVPLALVAVANAKKEEFVIQFEAAVDLDGDGKLDLAEMMAVADGCPNPPNNSWS